MHRLRLVAVLTLVVGLVAARVGPVSAATAPNPKVCAEVAVAKQANNDAEGARFDSGDNAEKAFRATLQRSAKLLVAAHQSLVKLVAKPDRPGVAYALSRLKDLDSLLRKSTDSTALGIYSKWSTKDVANFDVSDARNSYLAFMPTSSKSCGQGSFRVFLI